MRRNVTWAKKIESAVEKASVSNRSAVEKASVSDSQPTEVRIPRTSGREMRMPECQKGTKTFNCICMDHPKAQHDILRFYIILVQFDLFSFLVKEGCSMLICTILYVT